MPGNKDDLEQRLGNLEERLTEVEERLDALEELLEEPDELSEKDVMFENGEDKDEPKLDPMEEK